MPWDAPKGLFKVHANTELRFALPGLAPPLT